MGEQDAVRLNVTAHNYGESAYDAWLFVSHPASLNYTAHKTDVSEKLSLTLSSNSNLMPEVQNRKHCSHLWFCKLNISRKFEKGCPLKCGMP